MTPEQALQNLYTAARKAPLTADDHEILRKSAIAIQELIKKPELPTLEVANENKDETASGK